MATEDEDEDLEGGLFEGLYSGLVTDIADPEFRYRVRFTIPGMMENGSAWARMGTPGGGWPQRGLVMVPPVGAMVDIHFLLGDPKHPVYYPTSPPAGGALSHIKNPPRGGAVAPADIHRLWGWEGERIAFQVDERPGNEYIRIIDKTEAEGSRKQLVEMDLKMGVTALYARTQLRLYCEDGSVVLKGKTIVFNNRTLDNVTKNQV